MLQVALHVDLGLLAVRRRRQRDDAEDARADALGERADRAALAGGVASLEDDDDAQALFLHPPLQVAEPDLELPELSTSRFIGVPSSISSGRPVTSRTRAELPDFGEVVEPARRDEIELHMRRLRTDSRIASNNVKRLRPHPAPHVRFGRPLLGVVHGRSRLPPDRAAEAARIEPGAQSGSGTRRADPARCRDEASSETVRRTMAAPIAPPVPTGPRLRDRPLTACR